MCLFSAPKLHLTSQTAFNHPRQGEAISSLSYHGISYFRYSEHRPLYIVVAHLAVVLPNLIINYIEEGPLSILLTTVSQWIHIA